MKNEIDRLWTLLEPLLKQRDLVFEKICREQWASLHPAHSRQRAEKNTSKTRPRS